MRPASELACGTSMVFADAGAACARLLLDSGLQVGRPLGSCVVAVAKRRLFPFDPMQ